MGKYLDIGYATIDDNFGLAGGVTWLHNVSLFDKEKDVFALNIAYNVAKAGSKVLYFTLNLGSCDTLLAIHSEVLGEPITHLDLETRNCDREKVYRVAKEYESSLHQKLYVHLRPALEMVVRDMAHENLGLVVVDSPIECLSGPEDLYRTLVKLSSMYQVPVLINNHCSEDFRSDRLKTFPQNLSSYALASMAYVTEGTRIGNTTRLRCLRNRRGERFEDLVYTVSESRRIEISL